MSEAECPFKVTAIWDGPASFMPNGVWSHVDQVTQATPPTPWRNYAKDWGHMWSEELPVPRRPRGPRLSSFLGRETSFDGLTVDTAALPSDKMLDVRKACKLNLDDPLDPAGPAKIFRDNLETGSHCADKIGGGLFVASIGESSGTKFKGEMPVELGGQERENLEAVEDTCHDFASLLLHRLSRKQNSSINKAHLFFKRYNIGGNYDIGYPIPSFPY